MKQPVRSIHISATRRTKTILTGGRAGDGTANILPFRHLKSANMYLLNLMVYKKYTKVYINGHYLGDHKGGYTTFDFDLTKYIKPGEDNVLVLAVNNDLNDVNSIPPMRAGNFDVYGGIYRDVRLVIKSPLYIPLQGCANHEGGTFITTPGLTAKQGIVNIQTYVMNAYREQKTFTLRTTIVDADNNVVQVMKKMVAVGPNMLQNVEQVSQPIAQPHLWAPGSPYMYKVNSNIFKSNRMIVLSVGMFHALRYAVYKQFYFIAIGIYRNIFLLTEVLAAPKMRHNENHRHFRIVGHP